MREGILPPLLSLQTYYNEYAFRYNRHAGQEPMFISLLGQVVAKAE